VNANAKKAKKKTAAKSDMLLNSCSHPSSLLPAPSNGAKKPSWLVGRLVLGTARLMFRSAAGWLHKVELTAYLRANFLNECKGNMLVDSTTSMAKATSRCVLAVLTEMI
jgi:hypothetical protein